jgi:hypothetical protein
MHNYQEIRKTMRGKIMKVALLVAAWIGLMSIFFDAFNTLDFRFMLAWFFAIWLVSYRLILSVRRA